MVLRDSVGADYGTEFMRDDALQFDDSIYSEGTMKLLQNTPKFADFEFVLGDDEKIAAHKAILTSRLKVFEDVFNANDVIKEEEIGTVKNVSKDAFVKFLEIIYGSPIKVSRENLIDFLLLSDKYDFEELKEKCEEVMEDHLNPSNAIEFFRAATSMNLEEKLKLESFKLIQK
jgi:hypothetical protein